MLKAFNKMFIETLKLNPDTWLYILLAVVAVAFAVSLVLGLLTGEFKRIKSLMKSVASKPDTAVAYMKQMPVGVKKNYKRARTIQVGGVSPSDFLSQEDCVESPYRCSLISKVWLVTFVATVISAAIAFVVAPLAVQAVQAMVVSGKLDASKVDDAVLMNAPYLMPTVVLIVGGLLTLIGGIIGRAAHSGAVKAYDAFLPALDGKQQQQRQAAMSTPQATQNFAFDRQPEPQPVNANAAYAAAQSAEVYEAAEPVVEPVYQEEPVSEQPVNMGGYEPIVEEPAASPVVEPVVEPVVMAEPQESEEEQRQRAREEAIARMRQEQEMQAQAAAQAAAQAQAQAAAQAAAQAQAQAAAQAAAQAQAQAAAQAAAQAQAAAAAQAAAQAQAAAAAQAAAQAQAAQAQAAPTGSSSADDVIARIEQIDREGAPRETMREVATLLQKERVKPENKTPEQQKKLNEALSKLLKAMSAASRK